MEIHRRSRKAAEILQEEAEVNFQLNEQEMLFLKEDIKWFAHYVYLCPFID